MWTGTEVGLEEGLSSGPRPLQATAGATFLVKHCWLGIRRAWTADPDKDPVINLMIGRGRV